MLIENRYLHKYFQYLWRDFSLDYANRVSIVGKIRSGHWVMDERLLIAYNCIGVENYYELTVCSGGVWTILQGIFTKKKQYLPFHLQLYLIFMSEANHEFQSRNSILRYIYRRFSFRRNLNLLMKHFYLRNSFSINLLFTESLKLTACGQSLDQWLDLFTWFCLLVFSFRFVLS